MPFKEALVFLFLQFYLVELQTIADTATCGTTTGCVRYPNGCSGADCTFLVKWTPGTTTTAFKLQAKIYKVSIDSVWLAFAFSTDRFMGDDNVYSCWHTKAYTTDIVYNMFNNPKPTLIGNGLVGITGTTVTVTDSIVTCSFTRDNTDPGNNVGYFDTKKNQFYMLLAYGVIENYANVYHRVKMSSDSMIDFNSTNDYSASEGDSAIKAHGALMVTAWMTFVSIGLLLARYYTHLFAGFLFFKTPFWFILHRVIMCFATLLTIIGLIVAVAALHFEWPNERANWVHIAFGVMVIAMCLSQVIVTGFRGKKTSPYRYLFNAYHRTNGLIAFFFSIITIYLGLTTERMNLENDGWGVFFGWTLWMVGLVITLEVFDFLADKKMSIWSHKDNKRLPVNDEFENQELNETRVTLTDVELVDFNQRTNRTKPRMNKVSASAQSTDKSALPKVETNEKEGTKADKRTIIIQRTKIILLIVHIVLTAIFNLVLIILIALSDSK